jgi:hypothetical protein
MRRRRFFLEWGGKRTPNGIDNALGFTTTVERH